MGSTEIAIRGTPWERQPKESAPAWEAFVLYRDMGYRRSTAKVAQALGKTKKLIDGWCSRWNWVARADAYLAHLDERNRRTREEHLERLYEAEVVGGQSALVLAIQRLRGSENGDVEALDGNKLTASDVANLASTGSRLARLGLGEPTDLIKGALMIAPAEHQRQISLIVDTAMRYIPDAEQAAFLRELEAHS